MATQLQIRRGTSTQVAAFTGAEGEIVVNTTNDSVHVNDGSTAGGFELARADLNNVSDTSLNAALTGNTVSALTITTLTLGSTAITATGTEINLLDGVTATTAELNYVDGVTSAIQTQIDAKAPLASPTFTGTVTADGLTVDTNTLVVDATNNRVGIGTSTVNRALEIAGNNNGGAKANYIRITDTDTSATANNQQGGIEFFTNDVTAGISASMEVLYAGSGGGGEITFNTNASSSGTLTEALRIDENQNVGIGNSSPSTFNQRVNAPHLVVGAGSNAAGLTLYSGTSNQASINFAVGTTTTQQYDGGLVYHPSKYMSFHTNNGTERMRIDSSGNLLVGKTSTATLASDTNAGHTLYSIGIARHVASGSPSLQLTRTSSDGDIAVFTKDGTTVGSIGSEGGDSLYIQSGTTSGSGLHFHPTSALIRPARNGATVDGVINLGASTRRFKDLFLSGRSRIENNTNISMSNVSDGQLMISGNGYDGAIALDATGMHFYHNSSGRAIIFGTNETERARFEASGHLNVGFTSFSSMGSNNTGGRLSADGTTNALARGSNGVVLYLYSGSGGAGNITVTGNTASYNETSDQRLKENIVEAPSSSDDIDAIQVRSFDWKADGRHQKYGMIAQELNTVAPDAVTIPEDPDEMAGVDYSKLVPMLVKEIQSLRARVAQLENN